MDVIPVGPTSSPATLRAAIRIKRAQAIRLSRHDARRADIDQAVDEMVGWVVEQEGRGA